MISLSFLIGLLLVVLCVAGGFVFFNRQRIKRTLQRAKQGQSQAQYQAALWLYHGKKLPKDWTQAFTYMYRAAGQNYVPALNTLGALYRAGHGTEKDEQKAFACYEQAARLNDLEGMINLAVMYHMGLGVEKNDGQAFCWLKKAADARSPLGQRMLAEWYYAGIGTQINPQLGLQYYVAAAAQGEPVATAFLKKRNPHLQHSRPL